MQHHRNTTQTPNILFDHFLKELYGSELKVLLTVIRKTLGQVHPTNSGARVERAWISQKLFSLCCNLSGRAVSTAIDSLVLKKLLVVTDKKGAILDTRAKRRGATRLYFTSLLRLGHVRKQVGGPAYQNPVTKGHTIKLNITKQSCYNRSQGVKRLTDSQRYTQILNTLPTQNNNDIH